MYQIVRCLDMKYEKRTVIKVGVL